MRRRYLLAIVLLVATIVVVVLLWPTGTNNHAPKSVLKISQGIEGKVASGNGSNCTTAKKPVCYSLYMDIKDVNNKNLIKEVAVAANGSYEAALQPGTYTVALISKPAGLVPNPQIFTVTPHKVYVRDFTFSLPDQSTAH